MNSAKLHFTSESKITISDKQNLSKFITTSSFNIEYTSRRKTTEVVSAKRYLIQENLVIGKKKKASVIKINVTMENNILFVALVK